VAVAPRATLRLRRYSISLRHPQVPTGFILEHFAARGISQARSSVCVGRTSPIGNIRMKNRALNPGYAFALCYAAMVCLALR